MVFGACSMSDNHIKSNNSPTQNTETNSNAIEKEIESFARMSFDPRPEVRIAAAKSLEKYVRRPSAVYILMELAHDRDLHVRQTAREIIERAKGAYINETVKRLDEGLFASLQKDRTDQEVIETVDKLEEVILVEKDYTKAMEMLKKMVDRDTSQKINADQTKSITEHEMLEDIKDIDHQRNVSSLDEKRASQQHIASKEDEHEVATYFDGIKNLDIDDLTESQRNKIDSTTFSIEKTPIYRYVYEFIQRFNPTPKAMRDEMKQIIERYKRDVKLAVDLAWYRHKSAERELKIIQIKPDMKKVNLYDLKVMAVAELQKKKGRKFIHYNEFTVEDGTGSIKVIIEHPRCDGIKQGDLLDIEKAIVITENNTISLLVGKTSKLIIKR